MSSVVVHIPAHDPSTEVVGAVASCDDSHIIVCPDIDGDTRVVDTTALSDDAIHVFVMPNHSDHPPTTTMPPINGVFLFTGPTTRGERFSIPYWAGEHSIFLHRDDTHSKFVQFSGFPTNLESGALDAVLKKVHQEVTSWWPFSRVVVRDDGLVDIATRLCHSSGECSAAEWDLMAEYVHTQVRHPEWCRATSMLEDVNFRSESHLPSTVRKLRLRVVGLLREVNLTTEDVVSAFDSTSLWHGITVMPSTARAYTGLLQKKLMTTIEVRDYITMTEDEACADIPPHAFAASGVDSDTYIIFLPFIHVSAGDGEIPDAQSGLLTDRNVRLGLAAALYAVGDAENLFAAISSALRDAPSTMDARVFRSCFLNAMVAALPLDVDGAQLMFGPDPMLLCLSSVWVASRLADPLTRTGWDMTNFAGTIRSNADILADVLWKIMRMRRATYFEGSRHLDKIIYTDFNVAEKLAWKRFVTEATGNVLSSFANGTPASTERLMRIYGRMLREMDDEIPDCVMCSWLKAGYSPGMREAPPCVLKEYLGTVKTYECRAPTNVEQAIISQIDGRRDDDPTRVPWSSPVCRIMSHQKYRLMVNRFSRMGGRREDDKMFPIYHGTRRIRRYATDVVCSSIGDVKHAVLGRDAALLAEEKDPEESDDPDRVYRDAFRRLWVRATCLKDVGGIAVNTQRILDEFRDGPERGARFVERRVGMSSPALALMHKFGIENEVMRELLLVLCAETDWMVEVSAEMCREIRS